MSCSGMRVTVCSSLSLRQTTWPSTKSCHGQFSTSKLFIIRTTKAAKTQQYDVMLNGSTSWMRVLTVNPITRPPATKIVAMKPTMNLYPGTPTVIEFSSMAHFFSILWYKFRRSSRLCRISIVSSGMAV